MEVVKTVFKSENQSEIKKEVNARISRLLEITQRQDYAESLQKAKNKV